jgi:hypothetical protein
MLVLPPGQRNYNRENLRSGGTNTTDQSIDNEDGRMISGGKIIHFAP